MFAIDCRLPSRPRRSGSLTLLPFVALALLASPAQSATISAIEFLGSTVLPTNTNGITDIGGLSDLAFDPVEDHWVLLSDEARAFSMDLNIIGGGGTAVLDADITAELPLNLSPGDDDPEGIDIAADGTWWVSTEGNANANDPSGGFEPFVGRVDSTTGNVVEELPLPAEFNPIAPNGIRHNRGFEGVAVSPDGSEVFTGAEEGLSQDELASNSTALTRLIHYDADTGDALAQYPYLHDTVSDSIQQENGLVAMLSLGDGELLALERVPVFRNLAFGFNIRLFGIDLAGATDVTGISSIASDFENDLIDTVQKTLLLDLFSDSNIEGMAFGPENGLERTLLMVADDGDPLSDNLLAAFNVTFEPSNEVPAPSGAAVMLLGLAALGLSRRRRQGQRAQ